MNILKICNKLLTIGFVSITGSLFSLAALANTMVDNGYVRATIPGTDISSAYMEIINHSNKAITLVGASSNITERIEIHQHVMEDGMMKMRQREALVISAHDRVLLQPSGYHLMIFDLQEPLKVDQTVEITLHFKDTKNLALSLPVQSIKRKKKNETSHHHHH